MHSPGQAVVRFTGHTHPLVSNECCGPPGVDQVVAIMSGSHGSIDRTQVLDVSTIEPLRRKRRTEKEEEEEMRKELHDEKQDSNT